MSVTDTDRAASSVHCPLTPMGFIQVKRREFIATLGGAAFACSTGALADAVRTVGILMAPSETDPEPARLLDLLRQSLAELGWREGVNLQVELRWAHDEQARARTYARELVELGPDVIVATHRRSLHLSGTRQAPFRLSLSWPQIRLDRGTSRALPAPAAT
jgi:hypothetical protein